jgi:hypothetical protein
MFYQSKKSSLSILFLFLLILFLSLSGFPVHSAQEEILFTDNFEKGNAAEWQIISGTWEVKDGRFHQTSTEGNWLDAIVGKESWLDYEFEAKGRALKKGNIGIIFRCNSDRSKFYYFGFASAGKQLAIIQYENGDWSRKVEVSREIEENRDYLFKVILTGNQVRAFLDGEEIFNYFEINYRAGKVGLHTRAIPASFDEVKVSKIAAPLAQSGIDAYEVTNAEFKKFIEAGGYENPEYWSPMGWQTIQENHKKFPAFWQQSPYNQPKDPVVGVTWYESEAYCRWAGKRLPTDKEWVSACEQGELQKSRNIWEWTATRELGMGILRGFDDQAPPRADSHFTLQCGARIYGITSDASWGFRCIRK